MTRLEIHICDQRRSYTAEFATEDQALAFVQARWSTHAIRELKDSEIPQSWTRLYDLLHPVCEHGMHGDCYGPQHYYYDEQEQAAGFLNG